MKKTAIWVMVAAIILGGAYFIYASKAKAPDSGYVTEPVKKGDLTASVSATGTLNPKVSVLVGTEVSGTIREIYVDYNSMVKKGQVLLKLDQDLFKAQVAQYSANLQSAEARLMELQAGRGMQASDVQTTIDQKKATLDKDKANFDRNVKLFKQGMISGMDLDAAREAYLVAKAQYEQAGGETAKNAVTDAQIAGAKAQVAQARASLNTAETNLAKTVIKAPMDGIVVDRNVEVGQTVAASFSTPTLLTIGELGLMQVSVSIDEADVGQAQVGQEADFTVDAFPNRVFKGKVSKIYYSPVTVQNVVTYAGIVEVENPEKLLRPGMTANVKVITSRKKDVLMIPNSALRIKLDKQKKQEKTAPGTKTVYVMKGGKPQPVSITTGVTDFMNTEVTSGLEAGDVVVVDTTGKTANKSAGGGGGPAGGGMMRMGR